MKIGYLAIALLFAVTSTAQADVISVLVDVPDGTPDNLDIQLYAAKIPETPIGPLTKAGKGYAAEVEIPEGLKIVCASIRSEGWIHSYPELPDRQTDACVGLGFMKFVDGVGIIPFKDLKRK